MIAQFNKESEKVGLRMKENQTRIMTNSLTNAIYTHLECVKNGEKNI